MNSLKLISLLAAVSLLAAGPVFGAEYDVDGTHSQVLFRVKHLGISNVTGRFDVFDGRFSFDPKDPANASVSATVDVASVNTNLADRDKHLLSADFFDVENHPDMTFVSHSVVFREGTTYDMTGDLTLRGVTKPVIFSVTHLGEAADPWGNHRSAFEGIAAIDRRDFGLEWNKLLETGGFVVGNEVRIVLEIEGIRKKE